MDKSNIRVLVVDDELDIAKGMQVSLEMDGYQAETAGSAAEALEKIAAQAYHIVFTDINMPHMDGIQLLEKIKETRGETIVVMITAYTSLMKVLSCRIHGAADYILKPFKDFQEVEEVTERAYQQILRWDRILEETRAVKQHNG